MSRARLDLLATAASGGMKAAMNVSANGCSAANMVVPSTVICAFSGARSHWHRRDGDTDAQYSPRIPASRTFSSAQTDAVEQHVATPNSSSQEVDQDSSNGPSLSTSQTSKLLWRLAKGVEAERRQLEEKQHNDLENALRRKAINEQHRNKNYSKSELSGRLWDLVQASEALKNRVGQDEDAVQSAQTDMGAAQVEGGAPEGNTAPEPESFESLPMEEPIEPEKHRRRGVFEDIGVSQQAAWGCRMSRIHTLSIAITFLQSPIDEQTFWYEIATGDPLIHKESNTHVYLHSVNAFHAASVDCTRSMMQLLRPSLLAVALNNQWQQDLVVDAQARMQLVRSKEHLQRIADGYHRICMGIEEVSAFNTTVEDLRRSHREGQRVAVMHHMDDHETLLQQLQDRPEDLAHFQQQVKDPVLNREMWHAMFLSGMLPNEHYDRPVLEAHNAGHPVFCVDMPPEQCEQVIEQILQSMPEPESDVEEGEKYLKILLQLGRHNLPLHLPEDVWGIMTPAVLYPGQMDEFYVSLARDTPCTLEMMKVRGAYTARALQHLVTEAPAVPDGTDERRMLCLVDRVMEPIVRTQWAELQEQPDVASEETTVHNLPFVPRAIDRSKNRRRGNSAHQ